MPQIEILLREHVENLGKCGDVVKVRPGFARNYLFPYHLAAPATEENKRLMTRKRVRLDREEAVLTAEIDARLAALQGIVLTCAMKADDNGHLFGSVNAASIAALLAAQGRQHDEKDIRLDAPIKSVGSHTARIHVQGERYAEIAVHVNKEE